MKFHLSKIFWSYRALSYRLFLKKISMPSYLGKPIFIQGSKKISIGKHVRIFPHIRMEAIDEGSISIKDNVYIGQNCHITSSGTELVIEEGTNIMANVCITNIDHKYTDLNTSILEQDYITRKTRLGKNCFIGHGSVIQAGALLGDQVIVGANSVVCRDREYPDYSVIAGSPATVIKIFNPTSEDWEKV